MGLQDEFAAQSVFIINQQDLNAQRAKFRRCR